MGTMLNDGVIVIQIVRAPKAENWSGCSRTPDGAPCMLGLCMWPGCVKVSHMWYHHTRGGE